jgi:hypothetical protein
MSPPSLPSPSSSSSTTTTTALSCEGACRAGGPAEVRPVAGEDIDLEKTMRQDALGQPQGSPSPHTRLLTRCYPDTDES